MKGRWSAIFLAISMMMTTAACSSANNQSASEEEAVAVQVITIKKEPLNAEYNFSGTLKPEVEASIAFQVNGEIKQTLVEAGDRVKSGDVLAIVDDENAQLQLKQAQNGVAQATGQLSAAKAGVQAAEAQAKAAKAQLDTAEANFTAVEKGASAQKLAQTQNAVAMAQSAYDKFLADEERYSNLYSAGLISLDDYEKFQLQFKDAETSLENAKQVLSELTEGATPEQRKSAQAGVEQAQAGQSAAEAAVTQAKAAQMQAQAAYDQATVQLEQVQLALSKTKLTAPLDGVILSKRAIVGQMAPAGAEAFVIGTVDTLMVPIAVPSEQASDWKPGQEVALEQNGTTRQGTVVRVSPATNQGTGTLTVEVSVPNPKQDWIPGQVVRVGLSSTGQEGIFVPAGAVISNGQEPYVFKHVNGKAVKTVIELGNRISEDNRLSIASGLHEGDAVVSVGADRLFDGDSITIVEGYAE
ncbi:efflux RND transporter periplasmic adaptor subunit [Paenibacillus lentus]|uniref:Efflux RND transporter periplasmic adaptor subunit n=1 Tax=Paenibacillus lentus TaxID=1338368 RepID=A0A3Q8S488_9BACL|nr:efflux RND transporter periplasmic adaptor subunit [Paenibacillus lentus]AZK45899.1 efflux RND transporter periplasmic adaptor subunit [Paenibacillus lentus]